MVQVTDFLGPSQKAAACFGSSIHSLPGAPITRAETGEKIMHVVHLIGYLGKNPEHKSVKASDRKYAVLSLATQRSWKGADEEWHSKTEWHRVVAWNGLGEYAATKLRKGDHIYVEGTLVSSTFEKEFGKGKSKITVPFKAWQVKADSNRKLNRAKKEQLPDKAPFDAQPEEVPF